MSANCSVASTINDVCWVPNVLWAPGAFYSNATERLDARGYARVREGKQGTAHGDRTASLD